MDTMTLALLDAAQTRYETHQRARLKAWSNHQDATINLAETQVEVTRAVITAKDGNGKDLYSNELARKNEITARLILTPAYMSEQTTRYELECQDTEVSIARAAWRKALAIAGYREDDR
jgi:hypothetical protein